jgi:hypothetical protein
MCRQVAPAIRPITSVESPDQVTGPPRTRCSASSRAAPHRLDATCEVGPREAEPERTDDQREHRETDQRDGRQPWIVLMAAVHGSGSVDRSTSVARRGTPTYGQESC